MFNFKYMFCNKKIGIENIGFYTTGACFSLLELSKQINQDEDKFTQGIGQEKMSIITKQEDIITMAYNATMEFLTEKQKQEINLLLFATESSIDNSKSAGNELHTLLKLKNNCRCLEVKQACYGGTGALMLAKDFVKSNKNKKALVIASDVAFYGLNTGGEPTQGCGAIAILVSNNPKIAYFEDNNIYLTENKNDFYRPSFQSKPIYDGHFSIKCYLSMFKNIMKDFKQKDHFDYLITHMPFSKMLDKCCKNIELDEIKNENENIKKYNKIIGNTYTASVYIGLLSLLENSNNDLKHKKIAIFSYGSGAECECYTIKISKNYKKYLNKERHLKILKNRKNIKYNQYVDLLNYFENSEKQLNLKIEDNDEYYKFSRIKLIEIENGIKKYKIIEN